MQKLPPEFLDRMKTLLGDEYDGFLSSYESPPCRGLRLNTLKLSEESFLRVCPFELSRVPWAAEGFYIENGARPGLHPYHDAGAYYIQEPSAMSVAGLLDPRPGEAVLDLCAAPGGKTTHIAQKMRGSGILIANEIVSGRANILAQNVERMGVTNCVVTNETPSRLAGKFDGCFDRILVDAPCSGEGMFAKEENAAAEWSPENVTMCAARQLEILDCAASMLKGGGRLVYSTCTFSPEENERNVRRFLEKHPEFELEDAELPQGMSRGRPEWADGWSGASLTFRIWPHISRGEGHFAAVLKKDGGYSRSLPVASASSEEERMKYFSDFCGRYLRTPLEGRRLCVKDRLYIIPESCPDMAGLRVLRAGVYAGDFKKSRFEPSHTLAMALKKEQAVNVLDMKSGSEELELYLQGSELRPHSGVEGWTLMCVDGLSIGWGKSVSTGVKNHYPRGLRRMSR